MQSIDIYDNNFLQKQDLIELDYTIEHKGEIVTHFNIVAEVRANPYWLNDLIIWYGRNHIMVTDRQYENQSVNKYIKAVRDSIVKVYRKADDDTYACVWKRDR